VSRRTWAAGAAVAVVLASGGTAVALAAPAHGPVTGVTVHRFAVRDAHGHVVARGATATLPGHRPVTRPTMVSAGSRVATATRGHGVVVRVRSGTAGRHPVATR
jgi:hypothetical protein